MTRYFLACRLKYSRWTWVIFTDNMRQETLFRGLVACFNALGFVPWVLVFDNMKTVTTGRDDQQQPIWHRSLLQLAAEFDFHPEACWPASGNQKGSVESLVKFVKINFLAGRSFVDDADLQAQCVEWQDSDNTTRPSQATDVTPASRLVEEVAKGYPLADDRRRLRLRRARPGEQWCVGGRARQQLFGAHRARRRAGHGARPPRAHRHLARRGAAGRACPCAGRSPPPRRRPGPLRAAVRTQAARPGHAVPRGTPGPGSASLSST